MLEQARTLQTTAATTSSPLLKLFYGLFMNPFQALAEGQFLPVIVFSVLFGLAMRVIIDTTTDSAVKNGVSGLLGMFEAFQRVMFKIIDWVMRYFPIGVFALSASCFSRYGVSLLSSYFQVAISVIIGIMLMIFVCYPAFVLIVCHENPYPVLWKLREPILTAFVTRSSAATLPVSMRIV